MAKKHKAGAFIPKIIEAADKDQAKEILKDIAKALNIGEDFNSLREYRDDLTKFQEELSGIKDQVDALEAPYDLRVLNDIRLNLSFLYIRLNDSNLVFAINNSKIFWESRERTAKGDSFLAVKEDKELMESLKSKAVETVKLAAGTTAEYKNWSRLHAYAYGLFQDLRAFQLAVDLLTNSIASIIGTEQLIMRRDAK